MADLRNEHAELGVQIRRHEHDYYVLGRPSVSDLEFDRLLARLKEIETLAPELRGPDSPSHRVGSDLSSDFPEVEHSIPVLSLDKAYSAAEILTWAERCAKGLGHPFRIIGEEKIDGLSIVLYYVNGVFDKAVTRGNGFVGNDVSANVRTMREVPLKLSRPVTGAFRGEVYLRADDFDRLNRDQEVPYVNPRNLAGGSLRRVKSSEVAGVPLKIFVYEGFYDDSPADHWSLLNDLAALGFATDKRLLQVKLPEEQDQLAAWIAAETADRPGLPYAIDGLVFKIDELAFREELGSTDHHPRWAVAYKFESPQGLSRVIRVDTQVGRTGRITPVARIEPVSVGGATIQNVTLHNQDYINALDLAEGDLVAVSRRGDVIPAIEEVIEKNTAGHPTYRLPDRCPTCQSLLVREGAHDFCVNFDCVDRARGRLNFFVGRDQMDIDGLGSETIEVLWQQNLVRDLPDLYEFDPNQLIGVPGFGEKKIGGLVAGLAASKNAPYSQVLPSLGIPELGTKVASLLIENGFTTIDSLFDLIDKGESAKLGEIHGIGPRTVETLVRELSQERLRSMVGRLKAAGLQFAQTAPLSMTDANLPQVCAGQTWCVTGSFEHFKPREAAMDEVKKRGGKVVGDVSGSTTHLLAGEKAGGKLDKAQKLGVAVVSEAEFVAMLGL